MLFTPSRLATGSEEVVAAFRPGGTPDRSLARSAWESSPKEPSRRVRYDRAQLIPAVFLVESASRRTTSIVAIRNVR